MRDVLSSPSPAETADALTELILDVFRLNGSLLASGDALVGDLGLTSARWQVLGAIALAPHPLPVASLARTMGLSRQSVQRLVDEMKADAWVRLMPNPHHRRAVLVALTPEGEATYRAAAERQRGWACALAAGLSADEVRRAGELLRELRRRLDDTPAA